MSEIVLAIGCVFSFVLGHLSGELCWYGRGYIRGYTKAVEDFETPV